ANRLYNESYTTCPMYSSVHSANSHLTASDNLEYAWRSAIPLPDREGQGDGSLRRSSQTDWNHLSAHIATPFALPPAGSLDEFITEPYGGYTRGRNGQTREFRVAHKPWQIALATDVVWNCHIPSNYDSPFAEFLAAPPVNAIIAAGSSVQVFPAHTI